MTSRMGDHIEQRFLVKILWWDMTMENCKMIDIAVLELVSEQKSDQKEIKINKDSDEIKRFSVLRRGGSPNKDSDEIKRFSVEADHLIIEQ